MSSSQVSSDDFPRLVGAENFDVWKTRVCAALDGKHVLGYVMKPDYDGVSEDESDESESDMSDVDEARKAKPAEKADVDSDAVDTRTVTRRSSSRHPIPTKTPEIARTRQSRAKTCQLFALSARLKSARTRRSESL
ncbi:hypothetical protein PI125_g518 [Phytophthora idaei]|nr:hypothetical protein PI125_g512 [Phytophthora idaei]KAG3121204.1 hypothetical protein PI125_g518 [Phytophthora idaei]KAG3174423.1 hypothetical protein PI126_g389 [Phytophthora idaei]